VASRLARIEVVAERFALLIGRSPEKIPIAIQQVVKEHLCDRVKLKGSPKVPTLFHRKHALLRQKVV